MSKLKDRFEQIGDFFYYDLWVPITDIWYNTCWIFINIRTFWGTLWNYRDWDFAYIRDVNIILLAKLANRIENGIEDERSAKKKVAKIRELIELLKHDIYDETTEDILNGRKKGKPEEELKIAALEKQWNHKRKIASIFMGQDPKKFAKKYEKILASGRKNIQMRPLLIMTFGLKHSMVQAQKDGGND